MEDYLDWRDFLAESHYNVPLHALRYSATRYIGMYLSQHKAIQGGIVPDFGGLAELIGFDGVEIKDFERAENPGKAVLEEWKRRPELGPSLGRFVELLAELGREDILTDCRQMIAKEAQFFLDKPKMFASNNLPVQEQTVSQGPGYDHEEPPPFLTRDEVIHQMQVLYDAFICYNALGDAEEDMKFVRELIMRFENPPYKFKLFVPGRDDLGGLSKYEIDAAIISQRCRHMIVVLSKNFAESPACAFQAAFAHSLSPGAKNKRLIPVVIEEVKQMPNIMRFMSYCDFSKPALRDWAWDRLAKTIQVQLSFEDFTINSSSSGNSFLPQTSSNVRPSLPSATAERLPSSAPSADSGCFSSAGISRQTNQAYSSPTSSNHQASSMPGPPVVPEQASNIPVAQPGPATVAVIQSHTANNSKDAPSSPGLGSRAISKFKQTFSSSSKKKTVPQPAS